MVCPESALFARGLTAGRLSRGNQRKHGPIPGHPPPFPRRGKIPVALFRPRAEL